MKTLYYGTRLSENISVREPEGYLLCLNVPVARTGIQEYLPEELGLSDGPVFGPEAEGGLEGDRKALHLIKVFRPESEVFAKESLASFEGMPVTNNHPPEGVNLQNIHALQCGHAHNIRRGTGDESDLLLADLIITDPHLIDLILHGGKREISCGYTYELHEENGRLVQRKIRGNHVAVVDAGRAGPRVSIRDQQPERAAFPYSRSPKAERRNCSMKTRTIAHVLARMARDGDAEAVAEILEEMLETPAAEAAEEGAAAAPMPGPAAAPAIPAPATPASEPAPPAEPAAPAQPSPIPEEEKPRGDEDPILPLLTAMAEKLDALLALLNPAPAAVPDADPEGEDPNAASAASACPDAGDGETPAEAAEALPESWSEVIEEALEAAEETAEAAAAPETIEADPEREKEMAQALPAADALRAALSVIRPALARMPRTERTRICGDIAARLRRQGGKPSREAASDADGASGVYAALSRLSAKRPAADPAELGRRIMAARNPNYKQ